MAHIKKIPGYPAYQTYEQGNPISATEHKETLFDVLQRPQNSEQQQQTTLFDVLQHPQDSISGELEVEEQGGGNKEEKLKDKIAKGNREEPPATDAPDVKKIDPQLLSRGSQLKAMSGSHTYAKGGPK